MEYPGISIIVPVYNTSDTLFRCVASLYAQTFANFEVILVNDGSTDNSAELCRQIVDRDSRFSYHLKKNGGLSSARNYGLKFAKGEFIAFLDSDDFVDENFCLILYEFAKSKNLDILNFGLRYVKDDYEEDRASALPKMQIIDRDILVSMISESSVNKMLYFSWSNLYRRQFLVENKLVFDEKVLLGEDTVFNLKAFMLSKSLFSIQDPLYNYVHNTNSLTQKKYKENLLHKFECQFSARLNIHKEWPEINGISYMEDLAQNYVESTFFMLLSNVRNSPGNRHKMMKEMRSSIIYEFSFRHYRFSFHVSIPMMLRIFLFRYRFFNLLLII